jgi:hypothetical protein
LQDFQPPPAGVLRQTDRFGQFALRLACVALQGAQDSTVNLI